jgi:hypothetical protein
MGCHYAEGRIFISLPECPYAECYYVNFHDAILMTHKCFLKFQKKLNFLNLNKIIVAFYHEMHERRHNIQHNDTQLNDTEPKGLNWDTQHK